MPSIFITRHLSFSSPFQTILTAQGYRVHGESLIELEAVDFEEIPTTDWLFFYSKNAVRFFFETLKKQGKILPSTTQYAVIGQGTAAALAAYQLRPDFVGTGNPVETAIQFKDLAVGQKVLFPRASTSHQSIQMLLAHDLLVEDIIVYKNSPKTDFELLEAFDCLVFTSSMNARTYFEKYPWQTHQCVVAIGQPTAATLRELGVDRVVVAEAPTEEALARSVSSAGF